MITRVYGKADNFELEFKLDGGVWNAAVPADLSDGKYVCEFWAVDSYGYTSYYTGILYMFDGKAVLELVKDDIVIEVCPSDFALILGEPDFTLELLGDIILIDYVGEEIGLVWDGN